MVLSESVTATLITGCVGIVAVLLSKLKCIAQCDGCCALRSFKFGVLDNSLVDEHNLEFKKYQQTVMAQYMCQRMYYTKTET